MAMLGDKAVVKTGCVQKNRRGDDSTGGPWLPAHVVNARALDRPQIVADERLAHFLALVRKAPGVGDQKNRPLELPCCDHRMAHVNGIDVECCMT